MPENMSSSQNFYFYDDPHTFANVSGVMPDIKVMFKSGKITNYFTKESMSPKSIIGICESCLNHFDITEKCPTCYKS